MYTHGTKKQQLEVCKSKGYHREGGDGESYIAKCTKMRELKRDRQAKSSFLDHRYIYPYMYTYMSEEGKRFRKEKKTR